MFKETMRPRLKGQSLEISLSRHGYKNYVAECVYRFEKREGKYSLSMWIRRDDIEDRMRLSSKKIDAQLLQGTPETIVENICRVVHGAATVADENGKRFFDHYVDRYEYELKCFERGNELFEMERMGNANDGEV